MFKTHNIPSIGIDGVIYINYHFGSHIFFASLSSLLNSNTIIFYSMMIPIIVIPLFILTFFYCVESISKVYHKIEYNFKHSNEWYYYVFLLIFFTTPVSLKLIPYYYNWLYSQSFLFGLILFFLIISFTISYLINNNIIKKNYLEYIFFLIFFLIMYTFLAYTKISFIFVLGVIIGYGYLKFKLYKSLKINFLFFCLFLISLFIIYNLVLPMLSNNPSNNWVKSYSDISKVYIFYIYPSIFFIVFKLINYKYIKKLQIKKLFFENKLFDIEILTILIVVLFFVTTDYFQNIQIFLAYMIILSNFTEIKKIITDYVF